MAAELIDVDVLRRVENRGGGTQDRFRLGRSMAAIADSLADARGSYAAFLRSVKDSSRGHLAADEEEED
jgi:hypothetical protein